MKKDPNLYSMHLSIPDAVYGRHGFLAPRPIRDWLYANKLSDWSRCGGEQTGDGYTAGVTNRLSMYIVNNIQPEDATAFAFMFPHIKIHLSKQYVY